MGKPYWTDARRIEFKISPCAGLTGRKGGDWDLERRFPLAEAVKHRAISERYEKGRRWEETELFGSIYARRFAAGESVRGETTMKALLAQYYGRVDGMFESLRSEGFKVDDPMPLFLLGRGGEVFIGNQGNHRLAMCRVLGIEIAGRIKCRHLSTP